MNFVVTEMTFLKYFIPLTLCGNKNGIKSKYFLGPDNGKYNSPRKFIDYIEKISKEYEFEYYDYNQLEGHEGVTFMVEACGVDYLNKNHKKVVLTYLSDFRTPDDDGVLNYHKYIDLVDNVIFPNKFFAEYYNTISDKNLYHGSPKYDVLNKNNKENIILFFFPRLRDINKIDMFKLYKYSKLP